METTPSDINTSATSFLEWSDSSTFSMNTASANFQSLATLVKEGFHFDDALVEKAVAFLKTISPYDRLFNADDLLFGLTKCATANTMKMLNCGVISGILNILQPHTVSLPLGEILLIDVVKMLSSPFSNTGRNPSCLNEADAAKYAQMNEILFERVIVPSDAFIRHLCSNRFFISGRESMRSLLNLFYHLTVMCAFHPSTCTFVVSHPIALTITSLSSFLDSNFETRFFNDFLLILREWRVAGPRHFGKGKAFIRALNSEGFGDVLARTLFTHKPDYFDNIPPHSACCAARLGTNTLETLPWYS
ncbi:hypothetical protein BLNAU_14513 [Blattamonas nauphoetae]|uniref:Uncharacterized protein n=1 Tax=Blattamonas nauphoetae TaxID=2049346 RepID=A0ABQ9XH28_9EUKA|nr:hypothetical protein BLNAU_14513 [Blattamonas nauphoetae]